MRRTYGTTAPRRQDEPTVSDLVAIEAEWPLIEAEMAVLDAEILILAADGGPSPLDWRRLRRAEQRVLRESTALRTSADLPRLAAYGCPASRDSFRVA